ncbi:phage major capsid protein [Dehalococcoides sp.]|jgi:HK97 family phage major capsid protein|uniref:phage major capsid protein n=1 Tax=Dehalococcoides sp. TaxID=1966486 RepID=UPI003564AF03
MDTKELAEQIQGAVADLRNHAALMDEEAKKYGAASATAQATMEKLNTRIDGLELKLQKNAIVPPGEAENAEKKAHSAAFFKWMRQGKSGLEPAERKALVQDTTGLYLVPEEIEKEIIRAIPQLNIFRTLVPSRPITTDKIRKRTLTEVSMGWGKIETGASITESTPTPATSYIYAEDLYGLTKIGEDELADVDANLSAIIADSFGIARANAEEVAFAIGTGHTYAQPCGIAVDSTLLTSIGSGAGAGTVGTYGRTWTTDDTVTVEDLLKCEYALPAQYKKGAVWLMNSKTELALRLLRAGGSTTTDGPFLWQPSLIAGQPNTFDGFPVHNNDSMKYPADTTAGINVIFGNFQQGYRIVDRQGMFIQRLDELYSESGLVGFKAHFRVGGDIIRHAAFQVIANDV